MAGLFSLILPIVPFKSPYIPALVDSTPKVNGMRSIGSIATSLCLLAMTLSPAAFAAAVKSSASAPSTHTKDDRSLQSRLHFKGAESKQYEVGHDIPSVGFKTRNSWAGEMPIGPHTNDSYFFWLWGATEEGSTNDTVIWLNGGPGCSSLIGFLQEIGPFEYLPSQNKPEKNPYTWLKAASVLWVEQPNGVGFSPPNNKTINTEEQIAEQFRGFLTHFSKTFPELFEPGKRLWIAGESYAGRYIPNIAYNLLQKGNQFNLQGMTMFDALISEDSLMENVPVATFVEKNKATLNLKSTDIDAIQALSKSCGYDKLVNDYLVYPSKGALPDYNLDGCALLNVYYDAASRANPFFNVYRITDKTNRTSVLGDGNTGFGQLDVKTWFDNGDLQRYIHAKPTKWIECRPIPDRYLFPNDDQSEAPTVSGLLQQVLEQLPAGRNIIANGELDGLIPTTGVALALQNVTWKGTRGFTKPITNVLTDLEGQVKGHYRTERGFTFAIVEGAGHTVPSGDDQASVGLKLVKYMLGQVDKLS